MMKFLLLLLTASSLFAGDIVTATVTISSTSATNLNGTNAASITVAYDTRTWTNSVTSASTQILATTNASTAAFRLLQHLRAYPFSGVATTSTNNGVVLVGADGAALSITISNSWATVAYRTNTTGTGYVMRAPPTIESATTRTNVGNGVVAYINQAHTTTEIDQTAAAVAQLVGKTNSQSITGVKDFNNAANLWYGKYTKYAHSALAVDNAATNFVADFTGDTYRSITATNHVNFQQSTNRAAVHSLVIFVYPNGTNRNLTVPATWHALSAVDAVVTNTTIGVLSLTVNGTSETNVFYSYKAVP